MISKSEAVQINFTGGIVSPGYFKEILEIAKESRITQIRFGLRQQLIMDVPVLQFEDFQRRCAQRNVLFLRWKQSHPNIVSSYPAAGVFAAESWLREGVYKDIFDLFDYTPKLKINICDSTQSLVPFFTGHINWISSPSVHFWYLYIRFPKSGNIFCWPELIYTNEIPSLSKKLEKWLWKKSEQEYSKQEWNVHEIYRQVKADTAYVSKPAEQELKLPRFSLPYYEGFNKAENNLWLGIYRRDELFPISLLTDICSICTETKIGQLYTTPWKSIIIKDIEAQHRELWDYALGQHRINVRHAANELNWQVEDNNDEGLSLKRQIIRHFDKEDVRTFGLSFAVQTKPSSSMFGSVIIRKQPPKTRSRLKSLERFDILFARDFNPNSSDLVLFRDHVEKDHIGTYLVSLCKQFYQKEKSKNMQPAPVVHHTEKQSQIAIAKMVYQCRHCLSVYDESVGDEGAGIKAGTEFENLPADYVCAVCEAGKEVFIQIDETSLHLQSA